MNYWDATSTFETNGNGYIATITDNRLLSSFQGTGITFKILFSSSSATLVRITVIGRDSYQTTKGTD